MNNRDIPEHIGIIMDGNRRWAKERGLESFEGHRKGYEVLENLVDYFLELGIPHISFYAFSTENWKRSEEEVNFLLGLFLEKIKEKGGELHSKNIKVRYIGNLDAFSDVLRGAMVELMELTKNNTALTVNFAVNYGGRDELVRAVRALNESGVVGDAITEDSIDSALDTAGIPDPDLIIRTSGEQRLSNFLLWQHAYSELYFSELNWPDFRSDEFDKVLADYASRKRRFGK